MNVRRRSQKAETGTPLTRPEGKSSGPIQKDGRANLRGGPNYEQKNERDRAERIYRDTK